MDVYVNTRAQALSNGVLIDVTEAAREAGIRHPTAVTAAVWHNYVRVPEGVTGQDETGRLRDVLWMFRTEVQRIPENLVTNLVIYKLLVRNDEGEPKEVTLYGLCGPGDEGEAVITIMRPDEG